MSGAYYNENNSYAAHWLRNLIAAGHIAPGDVDERSIVDVQPDDLKTYTQCHFFAGIGGWSYAARLAEWPDDRALWTGSCPCQPFSEAGVKRAFSDERHLWPAFHRLIGERRPAVVFGEQVDSPAARRWVDLVQDDLEAAGYAFGAIVLPASSVGAPHGRHRTFFVADAEGRGGSNGLGFNGSSGQHVRTGDRPNRGDGLRDRPERVHALQARDASAPRIGSTVCGTEKTDGFWRDPDWLWCRGGKWRPVEPGTSPLADGISRRLGRLRAYGNAIVPQVAAEVIGAYMDMRAAA